MTSAERTTREKETHAQNAKRGAAHAADGDANGPQADEEESQASQGEGVLMAKFRKKPVVIDAVQVPKEDDMVAWGRIANWLGPVDPPQWHVVGGRSIDITTLEGTMRANPGDWIIKGVKGEFYPCKPDIFEATYEAVK